MKAYSEIIEQPYLGSIFLPEDSEYLAIVHDILANEKIQSMKNYMQHGNVSCLEHSINVSYMAYCRCKEQGLDAAAAARAGLLHDMFLYDWHHHRKETGNFLHGLTHPYVALKNAEESFDLSEKEKNMILRHMWPLTVIPPKYKEGFILMWYDKVAGFQETITVPFLKPLPVK